MIEASYRGLELVIPAFDAPHAEYLQAAGDGRLVVQQCAECGMLRGSIGAACPFCTAFEWKWHAVSGRGSIYSYQIVTQAIEPAFADWVPYPVVLVELDEQARVHWSIEDPAASVSVRKVANLVSREDSASPENESNVKIGEPVEVCFTRLQHGLALPQFRLRT